MRVLIVFNHPYEGSYCNAILESAQKGLLDNGHEVDIIHLDKDKFDPVMRAKAQGDILLFQVLVDDTGNAVFRKGGTAADGDTLRIAVQQNLAIVRRI